MRLMQPERSMSFCLATLLASALGTSGATVTAPRDLAPAAAARWTPHTAAGAPAVVPAEHTRPHSLRPAAFAAAPQLPPEILVDRHLVRADRLLAEDEHGAALALLDEILTPAPGLRSGAVAPAPPATAAQLPPEIMVDRHLVRVDRLLAADDPGAALEAMNEILALQDEHDLELANDFPFRYARVAFAAGRTETAITSLNEYLVAAGRAGEFYREALALLDSAEVRLGREEAERRRAEAERRRAARWPPGHVFRDCETCPELVVLPGSTVALGRYELTLAEYRAFASAPGDDEASRCYNFFSDRDDDWDHSWRNPGFPQTDRHPVTCVSWDDAQTYVSWLSRTSEATYRLPSWEELAGAAAGSQPGCNHHRTARDGTCPVGNYGRNGLGLSDLLGNVAEWTSRCSAGDCGRRWVHGGDWGLRFDLLQPAQGNPVPTADRIARIGFRVARTLE